MKFGKTDLKPDEIDFSLPAFKAPSQKINNSTDTLKVYTGQPVWSAKGNIGKIYPKGTRPNQFLYHYSRQFNSIELNATYYKIPTQAQVISWREQTPEDFKFCPKFPQFISHRKKLSEKSDSLDEFLSNIYLFENRLGVSFLQLPPHFSPEHISELKKFIDLLPEDMSFAIEFRHEDWFRNKSAWNEILTYMHSKNIAAVITDTPGRRDVLHLNLTNAIALIRFKGNNLHATDYQRIDQWVDRTLSFIDSGIRELYFFLHQEDESLGVELSQRYLKSLNANLNHHFRFPKILDRQSSLF
ncbi:MAG: DUF72 domain-containing protein [Cytophagales bacterium]